MISVLIPNYNKENWISNCLKSCIDQGNLLSEIIVVDDNSSDKSWEILRTWTNNYPKLIKIYKNPGKGANDARNYAFSLCSGKYIQWLDSDDYLTSGKFEAQLPILEKGEADIVYSDWRLDKYVDGLLTNSEIKIYSDYGDYLAELIKDNWNASHSYLMTKQLAKKLDKGIGWNPKTKVGQDREYFTMAGILGARFKYVNGIYAVYNKQLSGSISGMDFKKRLEFNQILENRFRNEIFKSTYIQKAQKDNFLSILDTHLLKACFYNSEIKLHKAINPFKLKWNLIHWKMKLFIPWIYVKKHLQLLF